MMNELPRMENLIPITEEEHRQYIRQCVLVAQEEILRDGFDEDTALDDTSNYLVELEKRMQMKLTEGQFKLFKEMRKGRDAFPWSEAEGKQ